MIKSIDCYNFSKISLRDDVVLLHIFKFNKQILKNDYFKTRYITYMTVSIYMESFTVICLKKNTSHLLIYVYAFI